MSGFHSLQAKTAYAGGPYKVGPYEQKVINLLQIFTGKASQLRITMRMPFLSPPFALQKKAEPA